QSSFLSSRSRRDITSTLRFFIPTANLSAVGSHVLEKRNHMKATETNFLKFLQGTKQFIIPIYQRTYSWRISDCQQLWDDILRIAQDDNIPAHFLGSI